MLEFLRFGSSIPGAYWGCCACCIIQDFKQEPSEKASIELLSGDGGGGIVDRNGNKLFAGPTYEDIFRSRIRIGTFSSRDMPNHGFLAILTEWQVKSELGKKWLAILKEEGFEFIRAVSNSVYGGSTLIQKLPTRGGSNINYLFGLFRNIGSGAIADPFEPPKEWTELKDPYGGDMSPKNMFKVQKKRWEDTKTVLLTEAEVVAAGAPVTMAGIRPGTGSGAGDPNEGFIGAMPESKENREKRLEAARAKNGAPAVTKAPWGPSTGEPAQVEVS